MGSDKSTILKLLGSLEHPYSGTPTWPVSQFRSAPHDRIRRHAVGLVFQDNLLSRS